MQTQLTLARQQLLLNCALSGLDRFDRRHLHDLQVHFYTEKAGGTFFFKRVFKTGNWKLIATKTKFKPRVIHSTLPNIACVSFTALMNAAHVTAWLKSNLFPKVPHDHKAHFTETVCARFAHDIEAGQTRSEIAYLNWTNRRSLALEPAALVALFCPIFETVRAREEGRKKFSTSIDVLKLGHGTTIVTQGRRFVLAQTEIDSYLHVMLINLEGYPGPWAGDTLLHLLRERLMPWPVLQLFHEWLTTILRNESTTMSSDFIVHNRPYARSPELWTTLLRMFDPDAARELDITDENLLRLRGEVINRYDSIGLGCCIRVWRLADGRRFWMASDYSDNLALGTCDERGRIKTEQGPFA